MGRKRATACAGCQRLRARLATLQAQIESLTATVAQLQQQLAAARKDSSTSSKPPSSDIVKPPAPPPEGQTARAPGGQPGPPRHLRPLLPPESLTAPPQAYRLEHCPACGHELLPADALARVVQQIEVLRVPL